MLQEELNKPFCSNSSRISDCCAFNIFLKILYSCLAFSHDINNLYFKKLDHWVSNFIQVIETALFCGKLSKLV